MLVEPFHNVYKRICFRVDFVDGMTVVGIDDHSENKYTVVSKQNYIVLFYYLNLFDNRILGGGVKAREGVQGKQRQYRGEGWLGEGERRMEGEGWGMRG